MDQKFFSFDRQGYKLESIQTILKEELQRNVLATIHKIVYIFKATVNLSGVCLTKGNIKSTIFLEET